MKHFTKFFLLLTVLVLTSAGLIAFTNKQADESEIISYTVDPTSKDVKLYWKNESGVLLKSIHNLKSHVESKNQKLLFAMNGGMYMEDNSPLGLFIQEKKKLKSLNTSSGAGNFYLKPNGVFYLTNENKAVVCQTTEFKDNGKIKYATQSGPMLVINGAIHSSFKEGSANLNIRNGVGVLPDGKLVFAMSKKEINFYDFASYFKNLGCKNALYLDGFVSRAYLPEKNWEQLDGNFGVMIGVTEPVK